MQKVIETLLIGLSTGSIYALMSLALVLVWRSTRVVNFAQAGQAMLSTYIGFEIASRSEIFWLGLVFAIAAGALVGAGVDYFFMRVLFKHATSGPAAVVAIAGAVGGVAGMLVTSNNFLSPYSLDLLLVFGFIAAVIGGLESMVGSVIGALVLGIGLTFILNYVGTSLVFIGGFSVLILVLLIKPDGIMAKGKARRA